jgi:glycosyltransferase involved in cell wall biosynthesis
VVSTARGGLGGLPLQVGYFRAPRVEAEVRRLVEAEQPDHLYCQLLRTAWAAEGLGVPCTIDYQDAFAAAMRRRAAKQPAGVRRAFELEADRIGRCEAEAFGLFDHHVVISEQDRRHLEVPDPGRVRVVPNGVDMEFFSPSGAPADDPVDVAFVGNMGYPPNVRAARFLAGEVMPRIRRQRPGSTLLLAGARPSRGVRSLAGPHVEVSGWLADIRSAYRRARVMVAPLFIGAGLQNKILEAMSTGVPVVTTELVNNAIGAVPGEELMVAATAEEFADRALELLDPDGPRDKMAAAASDMVARRFSWKAVGETLSEIMENR